MRGLSARNPYSKSDLTTSATSAGLRWSPPRSDSIMHDKAQPATLPPPTPCRPMGSRQRLLVSPWSASRRWRSHRVCHKGCTQHEL